MSIVPTFNPRLPLAGRYRLGPVIGIGGFGTVFDAFDEVTHSRVAVKSLRQVDPQRLFCFKQEFRLLADCRHVNLVRYYELFQERDRWYLAMEHVDGVDIMSHVRGAEIANADSTTMTHSVLVDMPGNAGAGLAPTLLQPITGDRHGEVTIASERELLRIRALLTQLANGLEHLHANHLVHRDLTPRNIMVDKNGRLVILDFGLTLRGSGTSMMRNLRVGTPKYMAPEQVSSEPSTPAADWYAVGSILYEMLTGIAPFVGSSSQVLSDKRTKIPVDPRKLYTHLPDDLCQLAMDCLVLEPLARPADAAERLRICAVATTSTRSPMRAPVALQFVGREAQLDRLDQTWRVLVRDHAGTVVLLRAPSGMGKSALIDRFVSRLPNKDLLLLRSRCYQHESVPFKALDGLADAIGEYLQDAHEDELTRLLPEGLPYLARLFPVLRMIPRIEASVEADHTTQLDPHEQRRRGFQALRALFHRLASDHHVVITIDDIQWGDEDSLTALTELLAPPDAPPILLITSGRTEDGGNQVIDRISQVFTQANIGVVPLEIGPLSASETAELAGRLLTSNARTAVEIDAAHRDSGGHPLFLRELVLAQAEGAANNRPTLRDLLARRLMTLDAPARRLMEVTAVAGRPRTLSLLHHAVGEITNLAAAVHQLGADRLVRLRTTLGRDELGVYHDKIAETAIALLSPEQLVRHHAALANALIETADADQEAEALSMHLLAAGDKSGGWRYGIIAADRASAALAFDRAGELYGKLLAIMPAEIDRSAFLMKMADALANAGRGIEAAKAYADAGAKPMFPARLHALQRAAGQYLRSGYMDEGLAIAKQVLGEVGLKWHENSTSALFSLLIRRMWLRLRGLTFAEKNPEIIPEAQRIKMDALWSLGHGLGGVDTVRGAEFHIRHLHLALQAGDPYRIGRGLAWESILNAAEGGAGGRRRGRAQAAAGHALAKRLNNDHAAAWSWAAEGYHNWCDGRWNEALACSEKAAKGYREECLDITWEIGSVYAWCWGPVLCYSGRLTELRQLITQVEREFGQLGDLYTLVTLRTVVSPWLTLADGEPERARQESADAVAKWSKKHWHLQHLFDRMTDARVALYQGDGARAADLMDSGWPRFTATMQNLLQTKRMFMHGLRGQAVIMAVLQGKRPLSALKIAEADAKRLSKEGTAWATSYATHLRAALHLARGNTNAAIADYRASVAAFDALGMPLHAAAARIRLGQAANDDAERHAGIATLNALGVKEPERYAATLVAGPAAK
jgi:eukaryotic-like serine/threonine-protein kinase